MRTVSVTAHTRRVYEPRLKCPCCGVWCKGRKGLVKHAVRVHWSGK